MAEDKSVFIWEAGWEEPFGNNSTFSCFRNLEILHVIRSLLPISMDTMHDPKEPVLLTALKIMMKKEKRKEKTPLVVMTQPA